MQYLKSITIWAIIFGFLGCAYYNTLFNAQARYDDGMKKIEQSSDKVITSEIKNDFQAAIDKCWKLINIYSDSSKYADDALLIIGKSHYQMEDYVKAERFLGQFVDRYKNSDLIVQAYLWLGMSCIELEKYDDALENFKRVLDKDYSDDLNARAYLNSGLVYLKQKNYDQARKQLAEVFDLTSDDEIQGNAQFLIAETYFEEGNFVESTPNFAKVLEYDAPVDLLFRSILKKVDGYRNLGDYDQAISTLDSVSTETKFLYKKSVVLALIGNYYELQGNIPEASDMYHDVLERYPRSEGSAMAAYGLGKLEEFVYSDFDSAKSFYQKVPQEFRNSEFKDDADERVKILTLYQKIERDIMTDLTELNELEEVSEEESEPAQEDSSDTTAQESPVNGQRNSRQQPKKKSASEIKKSLEKNIFEKAEFFLLTLARYDSAEVTYNKFIKISDDSILVPKAQYALYYIYAHELNSPQKADSIKEIILNKYPLSPYADFFNAKHKVNENDVKEVSPYQSLYLRGEEMISNQRYRNAIDLFNQIAEQDSGSLLAEKARYATAWIYENKLKDIQNAITAYKTLAKEYPNTEAGKIAQDKIKVPAEKNVDTSATNPDSTESVDKSALIPSSPDKQDDRTDNNRDNHE